MSEDGKRQDRWADWLLRGRQRGLADKQVKTMQRQLAALARRVLKGAKLRPGDRVLDVGAGTGLLSLGAQRKVGARGKVVASDVSLDALMHCRAAAGGDNLVACVGDALTLPFRDASFDVVLTRSVLIYLEDKPAGVRELFRALKPGGRLSIFEPINEVWHRNAVRLRDAGVFDDFQPTHDRILEHYRSSRSSTFLNWDERDVLMWFQEAGFSEVRLTYEHTVRQPPPPPRVTDRQRAELRMAWMTRPNPHDPSFEELVHDMLGEQADAYLDRFLEFSLAHPPTRAEAVVYLTARR